MILLDAIVVVVWREAGPDEGEGGGRVARIFLVMSSPRPDENDDDACEC